MERRRARDIAKQHRLNTEHGATIRILLIPEQIAGQYEAARKAMLA